jgi:hemerythrin
MSIEWKEDLVTGLESIDNQHREIFARFSLFSDACSDGRGGDELLNLVDFLSVYTVEHFRDEEKTMDDVDYPRLASHEKEHAVFLEEFGRFKEIIEEKGPSLENILNKKRAMIRWLINHIGQMDRAFADFIRTTRH